MGVVFVQNSVEQGGMGVEGCVSGRVGSGGGGGIRGAVGGCGCLRLGERRDGLGRYRRKGGRAEGGGQVGVGFAGRGNLPF